MKETLDSIFNSVKEGQIYWITGNSEAGKTTLAKWMHNLAELRPVLVDGDYVRKIWPELGFSKEDRELNNMRIARLAKMLSMQGFTVIVSTIIPFVELRRKVKEMTGCHFIYLSGGREPTKEYPYEQRGVDE